MATLPCVSGTDRISLAHVGLCRQRWLLGLPPWLSRVRPRTNSTISQLNLTRLSKALPIMILIGALLIAARSVDLGQCAADQFRLHFAWVYFALLHPVGRAWLRREEDPSDKISDMTIPFRIPSRYRMKESYAGKSEIPFSASVTSDCYSMEQWIRCYQIAEHAKILHSCLPTSLTLTQKTPQILSVT